MKNILYNTTRQWNCGDEFIMAGVRNLMSELIPTHNPVIFDRNPDLTLLGSNKFTRRWSNSWALQNFNFDYYVAAGTPEWQGPRNVKVNKFVYQNEIPSIFVGIGMGPSQVDEWTGKLLSRSLAVICRDQVALSSTQKHNKSAVALHCPAIFCTNPIEKHSLQRIGVIFQSDITQYQSIKSSQKSLLIKMIRRLSEDYDVSLICHYHNELYDAKKIFPDLDIYYSYDYSDYFNIYKEFDLTISTRLHGCFCSLACGIPTIMPTGLTERCNAAIKESPLVIAKSFEEINPSTVNVQEVNSQIITYKKDLKEEYLKKLAM